MKITRYWKAGGRVGGRADANVQPWLWLAMDIKGQLQLMIISISYLFLLCELLIPKTAHCYDYKATKAGFDAFETHKKAFMLKTLCLCFG